MFPTNSGRRCQRCGKPLLANEVYCTNCWIYYGPDLAIPLIRIAEALKEQSKKTRDWPDLIAKLAIPLVILIATIGFGWWQSQLAYQQHQSDQMIAEQQYSANQRLALDQQQAAILQTYLDNIQDLLLNDNLLKSHPTDTIAILAQARTLTALQGLDPKRKGALVLFLYEAHLIGFEDSNNPLPTLHVINLNSANLTNVDLVGYNLKGVNLEGADLEGADLEGANLEDADLTFTTLTNADFNVCICNGVNLYHVLNGVASNFTHAQLRGADLIGANLKGSNFTDADLSQAGLFGADLSNANLIGAKLIGANLSPAYLSRDGTISYTKSLNAKRIPTDLSGAQLSGANLTGANLSEAILKQSQLDQVSLCKDTILPNGLTCS